MLTLDNHGIPSMPSLLAMKNTYTSLLHCDIYNINSNFKTCMFLGDCALQVFITVV